MLFLILVSVFVVNANTASSQSGKLTMAFEDASLTEVFEEIESQLNIGFLVPSELLKDQRKISMSVKNSTVESILHQILDPSGYDFEFVGKNVVITQRLASQQRLVRGKITNFSGDPIPGATIVVKGTSTGTITDFDGNYTLANVPADAVLVFSFVGMKSQEAEVAGRQEISVVLEEETIGIEEVVAIGYGTQKKANLTGAVSAVKVDEKITSRSLTNVSSGLQGLIPGLSINQNSGMAGKNDISILIRGVGTVNNSKPLIVVDGMPDVDINRLNMHDIESISVLKDAASSAVYGSRAANGVILITTRSGKGQAKTKINISSSYAVENPTKAYEFMADYPRALTLHQRLAAVNTLRSNFMFKDGTIDQWMALGMIDPLAYPNTDWWDIMMRTGSVQNHNVSASGGTEKSNFFISIGILDEKGLQINNDYSRYNARFNYDYKVRSNMNVGVKFAGNWSKYTYALEDGFTDDASTNTAGFDMQYAIAGITPYDPVTGYFGGVMAYNEDPQAYNPYTLYINNLNYQNRQEANASAYWDWTPVKGLTARIDYALNYYNQFRYTASMPNRSYNFQTNSFGSRVYVGDNAGVANYTNTGYKTQLNARLNYDFNIGEGHVFNTMFAYSEEYWYNRYQMSSRNDRLHPSLHEIDAALTDIQSTGGNSDTEGLRSYIGRLNYTAFDKYLFEANFRYDGSSKFLEGSRFGFFPSAAFGWRFTEEEFMKSFTEGWLNSGKLRISYGGLGNNSGVDRYEQQETLNASNYMISGGIVKGFVYKKMVNTDLSWESTNVINIGMDLSFFRSQLTAELDYYDRTTTDMLRPSDLSNLLTGAYDAPAQNIGEMQNRGVEGNFTWRDKVGSVNYSVNMNASYNKAILKQWNEYLGRGATSSGKYVFIDMPYNYVYTYVDAGIAQTWQDVYNATPQGASPGDILREDLNGDGRIDGNDRKAYPNIQRDRPVANFAMSFNAEWKGFDLAVLLQGAAGRKDFWINIYNNMNFGSQRYASTWDHWENPWSLENRDGEWPRLGGNANREETTFWLDDLSYLRFKNVQLGYTLPKNLLQRVGIESVRIYGSAENLFTITKYRGLDPEKASHASDAYPLNKSFSLGINIGI
ncbi:MAG: SusC/RagA family TonB-linked outer membrane protein [Bacteroidetes bacterium GWF2_42_66]|nr:MAG: SusC/RagA family TonB-linked outer membrane protein [Bacteroidetes bacterium GWE2_42_39]OFY43423.1 MAG: SusC/RagA family TonB-linked outer membrane protein [Bacteroidetes bacterium GWF2_42_66]HBL76507.1 SusC/RagA family TonB-linked outer membrane protein [Prolixibacteraceae bacterium]HCU63802.1 SusC/RagA family TonB-linked outer membrane protein [Prolixibacteraceae bacterium]